MVQQSWVDIIEQTLISHTIVHLFVLRIFTDFTCQIRISYKYILQPLITTL